MLTASLFDEHVGQPVEDWEARVPTVSATQVLWVDVVRPSPEEEDRVRTAFTLRDEDPRRHDPATAAPQLSQEPDHLRITAVAAPDGPLDDPTDRAVLECFIGMNWVVTVHQGEMAVLDDFRSVAGGAGDVGALDAPSFLATLLEWVVTSYSRAFGEIEMTLERLDTQVLNNPRRDVEEEVAVLVRTRHRVGLLRRSLEPHRELFSTLAHAELDLISTEASAERFAQLAARVDAALGAARDAKQAVVDSFDMLILRTEHRTNEIVKVLTLTSILLLPGTLIAGLMGMNVNLSADVFRSSALFWSVLGAIAVTAGATLIVARLRRWI